MIIQFQQSYSNKIQFISDYIINYCKDDGYKYILLIHIKRKFLNIPLGKKESIYSIPNINNYISNKNFEEIMFELGSLIDEETEFKKTLLNFIFTGIISRHMLKINPEEYIDDLNKYIDNNKNKDFKLYLIKKTKKLIDEDENQKFDNGSSINKILKEIKKNNVDLKFSVLSII